MRFLWHDKSGLYIRHFSRGEDALEIVNLPRVVVYDSAAFNNISLCCSCAIIGSEGARAEGDGNRIGCEPSPAME